jgi:hypothetical protein
LDLLPVSGEGNLIFSSNLLFFQATLVHYSEELPPFLGQKMQKRTFCFFLFVPKLSIKKGICSHIHPKTVFINDLVT